MGRGCNRMNMVQILCTHVHGKISPVEIIPGMGRGDKGG
jgi:hypothetical protein